ESSAIARNPNGPTGTNHKTDRPRRLEGVEGTKSLFKESAGFSADPQRATSHDGRRTAKDPTHHEDSTEPKARVSSSEIPIKGSSRSSTTHESRRATTVGPTTKTRATTKTRRNRRHEISFSKNPIGASRILCNTSNGRRTTTVDETQKT